MFCPSTSQINSFNNHGFVVIPDLFSRDEAEIIRSVVKSDETFNPHKDHSKFLNTVNAQLVVWNKVQESLWGAIASSERVVNTMEALLGFEVYHYHSKLSIKHPGSGGKW